MATLSNDFPNGPSYLAYYLDDQIAKSSKRGEGSRGGKIIGHTKSGKPVYAPGSGGRYSHMAGADHYFKSPEDVSQKDSGIVMGHYPGFSAADHQEAGEILEGPNHHTAAAAHFMAAQKLAFGNPDKTSQISMNNFFGASDLKRHNIEGANGKLGRTHNGHLIPGIDDDVYERVHLNTSAPNSAAALRSALPHFSKKDHAVAGAVHASRGKHMLQVAQENMKRRPDSVVGREFMNEANKHLSAAEAHMDLAKAKSKTAK